jgi:hypothetical protein
VGKEATVGLLAAAAAVAAFAEGLYSGGPWRLRRATDHGGADAAGCE